MAISNTTAKDFENQISYLNSWWNVLSDWCGQFFLYLHSFTPKNGCKVGQYYGPNRPQHRVFGLLRKIESLFFSRNGLRWSILWLANFLWKSHIWENFRSRDLGQKALDQSDHSIFKLLYLLNHLSVFYNFLHIDIIL